MYRESSRFWPDARPDTVPVTPWVGRWLTRPRRILFVLGAIWILSLFDLSFTVLESSGGHFVEMNPIAARLLGGPLHAIVAYKFALVGVGSLILLFLRRHFIAELGCWFLFASYAYVLIRWYVYYGCLLHDAENVLLRAPLWTG